MLSEANVTVRLGLRLSSVTVQGERIRSVHVQPTTGDSNSPAQTVAGSVFIDASYEGDLLAQAGAPWTVGREGRMEYGELQAWSSKIMCNTTSCVDRLASQARLFQR